MANIEINQELEKIYNKDGELTPSTVVKSAKSEKSVLHKYFEWDDPRAGHLYRLMQARKMIRVARITIKAVEQQFIHVPSIKKAEGVYKPVSVVIDSISDFSAAMAEATTKLSAAMAAVKYLEAMAEGSKEDTMAKIAIALKSIATAQSVVKSLH